MAKAAVNSLKPGAFVGDAWALLCEDFGAAMKRPLPYAEASVVTDGVYVSAVTGAPLFSFGQFAGVGPEGLEAFSPPADVCAASIRICQHLRTEVDAKSQRTHLRDATSGAEIGYALGAPSAEPSQGRCRLRDASLLLVDQPSVTLVPRGEAPPASVPLPAAPAMRRLLQRAPSYMGSAYVVTLAGGPPHVLLSALSGVPGVLEATSGYTGGEAADGPPTYAQIWSDAPGLVEAVQLAVDPSVEIETLLAAYFGAHDPTSEGGGSGVARHAPTIFYHSEAQRDAALASRARLQQATQQALTTSIRPAAAFWEAQADDATRD